MWVKLKNLESGSVLRIVVLWPLRKPSYERDTTDSSTCPGFNVSEAIERGGEGGYEVDELLQAECHSGTLRRQARG